MFPPACLPAYRIGFVGLEFRTLRLALGRVRLGPLHRGRRFRKERLNGHSFQSFRYLFGRRGLVGVRSVVTGRKVGPLGW